MSLPPGFLDELRTRTSLADIVGQKVAWDSRKSNRAKGDMWAPCPFHQERTASFHVDDAKGFYYCFGCHAKGDALTFLRETENLGFMEAVESLAAAAGMEMPQRDPEAKAKAERRTGLSDIVEQAVRYYRRQLATGAAREARAYLDGRGLDEAAQGRWEIGFAPGGGQALFRHLTEAGVAPDRVIAAGLAAQPDDGGAPYDRLRNRIVFPMRDTRGRAMAFGGRALSPGARAKYLNSPETELFDKGASLYNHGPARDAAGKGHALVLAEGYMDVIALVEAGFEAAVAPLGTAITETQLRHLWRMSDEPVIALDGDTGGQRAATQLMDLALPLMAAGQGLRFVLLPEGEDPDDLLRREGPAGMRRRIEAAEPMVRLLWRRETAGGVFDSPERRAALDKRLRAIVGRIADPSLRRHYADEIGHLRRELFGPTRQRGSQWGRGPQERGGPQGGRRGPPGPEPARPVTKATLLAGADAGLAERLRESVILASLVIHPGLVERFRDAIEALEPLDREHRRLRDALLAGGEEADSAAHRRRLEAELGTEALEKLFKLGHVRSAPPILHPEDTEKATFCVAEDLAKLSAVRGAEREIADAIEDIAGTADEGVTWRLAQAASARDQATRHFDADRTVYDIGPNGARMDRDERSLLHRNADRIEFAKSRPRHR